MLLTVGIGINGDGRVKVTVQDNGVGIPPENLIRIFSHGFTTRKGGHGFGLHSGANAAREMGGFLTARSDGLGSGAMKEYGGSAYFVEGKADANPVPFDLLDDTGTCKDITQPNLGAEAHLEPTDVGWSGQIAQKCCRNRCGSLRKALTSCTCSTSLYGVWLIASPSNT